MTVAWIRTAVTASQTGQIGNMLWRRTKLTLPSRSFALVSVPPRSSRTEPETPCFRSERLVPFLLFVFPFFFFGLSSQALAILHPWKQAGGRGGPALFWIKNKPVLDIFFGSLASPGCPAFHSKTNRIKNKVGCHDEPDQPHHSSPFQTTVRFR